MPKRPGKKGMEGNSGPLWAGDDEGDEEVVPPTETVSLRGNPARHTRVLTIAGVKG